MSRVTARMIATLDTGISSSIVTAATHGDVFAAFLERLPADPHVTRWPLALREFANAGFPLGVRALLRDPSRLTAVAERSYIHGNGFAKIVLARARGRALRLHLVQRVAEENIHDHRWAFASTVLSGTLTNVLYRTCRHGGEALRALRYGRSGERAETAERGSVRVVEISRQHLCAGSSYSMTPSMLHKIEWGESTATLVVTEAPVATHNRLFTAVEKPRMREETLSPDEVRAFVCQVLAACERQ